MKNKLKSSWWDHITGKGNQYNNIIKVRNDIRDIVTVYDNINIIDRYAYNIEMPSDISIDLSNSIMFTFDEIRMCRDKDKDAVLKELIKRRDNIINGLIKYKLPPELDKIVTSIRQKIRQERINSIMSD